MVYSDKVVDHFNNPRNIGSLDKNDPKVGTGIAGAPECGDVMKLQIKVVREHLCQDCQNSWLAESQEATCPRCNGNKINIRDVIVDAKFKTFGCGSAIASSSLATEWLKGKTPDEALEIKNTQIVNELSLPPVKIHCSVLAEDAIRAAVKDFKKKQSE
ncbi:MAG: iron-sulfur cluster assembly scaffold protein [Candidatus Niyogibacteria bacterium]|nr:MAG: iron-sulfur cluster assembly scaffold protein [Candidatus Niyogibacteria bacterium]